MATKLDNTAKLDNLFPEICPYKPQPLNIIVFLFNRLYYPDLLDSSKLFFICEATSQVYNFIAMFINVTSLLK